MLANFGRNILLELVLFSVCVCIKQCTMQGWGSNSLENTDGHGYHVPA